MSESVYEHEERWWRRRRRWESHKSYDNNRAINKICVNSIRELKLLLDLWTCGVACNLIPFLLPLIENFDDFQKKSKDENEIITKCRSPIT